MLTAKVFRIKLNGFEFPSCPSKTKTGTVMQIEKALIGDHLLVLKVSWKLFIPTIFNFPVIYQWDMLFS